MPSDWEMREVLFPLLNYRIENKLTTFFTSNFSLTALKEYYEKKCDPVACWKSNWPNTRVKTARITRRRKLKTQQICYLTKTQLNKFNFIFRKAEKEQEFNPTIVSNKKIKWGNKNAKIT